MVKAKALAARSAEWERLQTKKVWDLDSVREWDDVAREARARQAKDPKLPAQIRSWLRVARDPQKSQMRVAQQMINHLNAPQLAIRHISDQLLRQITGVSAKSYRPDATVAERRRGVQEWKRNVLRLRKSGKLR